ncbi:MAG: class II glutamine amidotransferase [Mobilicoccus sp.]|nr:class II glutamine amidotransferase [Mobilicoccus sp.]
MCRLLAYVSPSPSTFTDVIGVDQGAAFQWLARVHDDGWGTMWLDGGQVERQRTAEPGHTDAALTNALNGRRSRAGVAHLRLATGGLSVGQVNTHPFVAEGIGFAHNGSILPVTALRAKVSPARSAACEGTTDSELYFALIRDRWADGLPLAEAVTSVVAELRQEFPAASLNAMVLGAHELVVVRASRYAEVPTQHFIERGIVDDDLPPAHDEAYYDLRVRRGEDGSLAFASSGLDTTGWEELPQDSVTVVDLDSVTATTHLLHPVTHLAG